MEAEELADASIVGGVSDGKIASAYAAILPVARSGVMAHKKLTLPSKICLVCQRPFAWRKKWERDWEAVRYCSDRCRTARGSAIDR